jgi:hypothetical protein
MDAGLQAGRKAGFEMIDGTGIIDRRDGTVLRPTLLMNGQRHRSRVEVRKDRVTAFLDGQKLVDWGKSRAAWERVGISPNEVLRDAKHLGLAALDRATAFHRIEVHEFNSAGTIDP